MQDLRDVAYQGLDEFSAALDEQNEEFDVGSPAQEDAGVIFTRLKATFKAIALLIENGYLDEAVMLIRRQTEDSLRLHYMYAHRDLAKSFLPAGNCLEGVIQQGRRKPRYLIDSLVAGVYRAVPD